MLLGKGVPVSDLNMTDLLKRSFILLGMHFDVKKGD